MNLNSDLLLNLLFGVTSFSIILSIYLVLSSFLREKRVKEILNSNSLDLSSQYEETSHILEAEKKSIELVLKKIDEAETKLTEEDRIARDKTKEEYKERSEEVQNKIKTPTGIKGIIALFEDINDLRQYRWVNPTQNPKI